VYLVTSTVGTKRCHLGHSPIVQHEVYIGEAEAGGVQLDEDLVGRCTLYVSIS
jgi:hypothetical protein